MTQVSGSQVAKPEVNLVSRFSLQGKGRRETLETWWTRVENVDEPSRPVTAKLDATRRKSVSEQNLTHKQTEEKGNQMTYKYTCIPRFKPQTSNGHAYQCTKSVLRQEPFII